MVPGLKLGRPGGSVAVKAASILLRSTAPMAVPTLASGLGGFCAADMAAVAALSCAGSMDGMAGSPGMAGKDVGRLTPGAEILAAWLRPLMACVTWGLAADSCATLMPDMDPATFSDPLCLPQWIRCKRLDPH